VVDVTDYDDMQELISMADIAITDYSSWIYDFVLQRSPGFIFVTDIDLYDNERGFCYPLKSTPFPIATNNAQLKANILAFEDAPYQQKVEAFLQDKGCMEDGRACERTVNTVLAMMKKDGITFNHANNEA
jgi:CDP-glycerol glycerophosphotransferase